LQSLASDLAEQRRKVRILKRENARLSAELSTLRAEQ